jgi:hypothetical protein
MSPQSRKISSESKLRALRVPINEHLPLIESEEETTLRSVEDVHRRLVALWAVVGKALLGTESRFARYIVEHQMEPWLSNVERQFILDSQPAKRDGIHFSWQLEALFFVAWCAGLVEADEVPTHESSVQSILDLFPQNDEPPDRLQAAIAIRPKSDILDRADLLYRLHWAVRNAQLTGSSGPSEVNGGVVQEWHRAVNWMVCYNEEDDWDQVGTDT